MGEPNNAAEAGKTPSFEEFKPMLRPTGIINGIIKVDVDKCTGCGLCIENCALKCMEMDEAKHPKMKEDYLCASCSNCIAACPQEALSFARTYGVEGGFFDVGNPPVKKPLEPKDEEGKPAEWTQIEKIIMERRSVRNFKKTPVPEPLIRRVLEAGRFAPSGGNHQPWKFTVVTDPDFIAQLETACQAVWAGMYPVFKNDETVADMVGKVPTGVFDPRTQGGLRRVAEKLLPVFFSAPAVIFLGGNQKLNNPAMAIGICGENMTLTAFALGLGSCWSNFAAGVNFIPEIKSKLGFDEPWNVESAIALGYPRFKQTAIVARQYRPVTWFRPGAAGSQLEE